MYLIEADSKQILADHGLPTTHNRRLFGNGDHIGLFEKPAAVKAQLLSGGRGKAGLVKLANAEGGSKAVRDVLDRMQALGSTPLVLVEDQIEFAEECYLAWRIDDINALPALMFSRSGGVDIEDHPESIRELKCDALQPVRVSDLLDFFSGFGFAGRQVSALARFATDAQRVLRAEDATLVEINPLAITVKGDVIALDAKITLDENASVRHGEWSRLRSHDIGQAGGSPLERRAAGLGFTFIELDGDIALFTGGAGLGMAMVDMLADAGYRAANFVDAPGGSGQTIFGPLGWLVFERAQAPEVKAIVLFLTLSATSLKGVVEAILDLIEAFPPPKPLVVGIVAAGAAEREMTLAEAQREFRNRGHECVTELAEAVAAVDRVVKTGRR